MELPLLLLWLRPLPVQHLVYLTALLKLSCQHSNQLSHEIHYLMTGALHLYRQRLQKHCPRDACTKTQGNTKQSMAIA
jgi:hypothetical protein